jgi:hypothetical protein
MTAILSVRKEFTRTPGPRYTGQGKWSGEEFRKILTSWLKEHESVLVDLDGTAGYGSSFIDETFGGLVREGNFTPADIKKRLEIKSDEDPSYKLEALEAIEEASRSAITAHSLKGL